MRGPLERLVNHLSDADVTQMYMLDVKVADFVDRYVELEKEFTDLSPTQLIEKTFKSFYTD